MVMNDTASKLVESPARIFGIGVPLSVDIRRAAEKVTRLDDHKGRK
jgi:hypothetical protein